MIIHTVKKIIKSLLSIVMLIILLPVILNVVVVGYGGYHIIDSAEAGEDYDCIMVLGCSVIGDTPSNMLKARLDRAIELYKSGASDMLLLSGDTDIDSNYDEVAVMKQYAIDCGVDEAAIITDNNGFSTYESMYRAKNEFSIEKILVVTQRYHLYRAVYDARLMGLKADGVVAVAETVNQSYRQREFLARIKDFFFTILKPTPETIAQYEAGAEQTSSLSESTSV